MALKKPTTNRQIEDRYVDEDRTVSQERNDFLLPQILDFVQHRKWLNLQPEYQRRQVWDRKKRSLFIESLLMNLPVPPVFLFEPEYSRYEVMDGQQRLATIVSFYSNHFKLTGLERWSELNGRTYAELPLLLQRGLDRRRISAVILQTTSTPTGDDQLRRIVFERLNTGGQKLNAQELRNCLYASGFATLLVTLAGTPIFNDLWEIPRYHDHIRADHISSTLAENTYFKRMIDCEIVLRFFAFRNRKNIKGAVKTILDNCMASYKNVDEATLRSLQNDFETRIQLAHDLFGLDAFKIKSIDDDKTSLSLPYYDSVIIACDRLFDRRQELMRKKKQIRQMLEQTFKERPNYELIVGRANTADAIKKRLDLVEDKFLEVL